MLIKGRCVEIDRDKLTQVLDHWQDVQRRAQAGKTTAKKAIGKRKR